MKVNIPKGTRDFGPEEIYKRRYIFDTIQKYFERYGFAPIETPAMENLDTLMGKYGDEGDQLLFKVLNNGDFLAKVPENLLEQKDSLQVTRHLARRGMRYDLTIPFARFAVMHRHELALPFKRYQIQPVWRADRPQKGRYQEFYQCDADVIGSDSLQYEAEFILLYDEVFSELGIDTEIRVNNRKLLTALSEKIHATDHLTAITTAIDKLDKIGKNEVEKILTNTGLSEEQTRVIMEYLTIDSLDKMELFFENIPIGVEGIREMKTIYDLLKDKEIKQDWNFDPKLARGLTYYTGTIIEVKPLGVDMGSIGGGGRYDNLTELFGGEPLGGVGISFGAERIYDIMEELNLFKSTGPTPPVLILTLDTEFEEYGFDILYQLRKHGIRSDLYPSGDRMRKQMRYANRIETKYVLILGSEEWDKKEVTLRNMESGTQENVPIQTAIQMILDEK